MRTDTELPTTPPEKPIPTPDVSNVWNQVPCSDVFGPAETTATGRAMSSGANGRDSATHQTSHPAIVGEPDQVQLSAILAGSPDAIWCWRIDGSVTRWNPAAERLFGYAAQDIIGRSLLELIPHTKRSAAE